MNTAVQVALWGLATCFPVVLSLMTHKLPALGLSTMLLLGWAFGRLMAAFYGAPASMAMYPVMDALFGALAFMSWRQQREFWKLAMVGLFVAQCCGHVAFWLAYPEGGVPPDLAHDVIIRYIVANNVCFALELLCVAWAGGIGDVARDLGRWVSDRAGPRDHAGAS